ncbi:MAG: hypothetical protein ACM3JH_16150 [Acidithiobacillales bacterium]
MKIAGTLQPIEFFDPPTPLRAAGTPPAASPEVVPGTTALVGPDTRPVSHILFFVDLEQLPLGAIHQTAPALREAAGHVPAPARLSVASNYGGASTLVWEEDVLDQIKAAVDSLETAADEEARDNAGLGTQSRHGSVPVTGESPRNYERRRTLEMTLIDNLTYALNQPDPNVVAAAWRDINDYVASERVRVREMLKGLRGICEEFARLDGRKALVLVSRGFERAPGFNFLNAVEVAVKGITQPGAVGIQPRAAMPGLPGSTLQRVSAVPLPEYDDFVRWIAASGITLHFLDPSSATDVVGADVSSSQRFRPLADERRNLEDSGANLAAVTGGMARFEPGALAPALATFLDASSGTYRLGIRMTDVDPRRSYKVSVSVKRSGVRALARSAYRPKLPGSSGPAAVAEADRQRIRSGADERRPGAARRVAKPIGLAVAWKGKSSALPGGGKNLYKLDVLIPYDDLQFLPEEDSMVASARIAVVAESAEGKGRERFSEDLFLSMTGKEYSDAAGAQATKTLTLTLLPGRWHLSVSVTDLLESRSGVARATVVAEP